jgi:outer membrane biogenesis lipoprotein LolB
MIRARMLVSLVLGLAVLPLVGCGSSESNEPKKTLSEKEQEQIKQYQEQREQEWGGPKKAKK